MQARLNPDSLELLKKYMLGADSKVDVFFDKIENQTLLGRFQIKEMLGSGQNGSIYDVVEIGGAAGADMQTCKEPLVVKV